MNPFSKTTTSLLVALLAGAGLTVAGAALAAGNTYGGTTTQPAPSTAGETSKMAPTDSKAAAPSKAESSDMAFKKLDMGGKGYVTKDDTRALSGFDKAFQDNDANHDGKLTQAEFKKAWGEYSGAKQ